VRRGNRYRLERRLFQPFLPIFSHALRWGLGLVRSCAEKIFPRKASRQLDARLVSGATIIGFMRAECGVGEAARRLFLTLKTVNYPVAATCLTARQFEERDSSLARYFTEQTNCRYDIFNVNANDILRRPSLLRHSARSSYRIGVWAWELARFPHALMKAFDHLDEVWVPSKFVYDAVAPASTKPVAIFPHAVPSIEPPATYDRNYFGLRPDAFVILVAFDLNSHLTRKNPQGAIEAVRRAFGGAVKPNVQLVIKLHGLGFSNARKKVHKALGGFPEAVIIDRVLSREEMWGLQACCDVYLSLHRSEGFGLNIAECMALGKCVIATNYSGNTDYFDKTCGAPVGYSLIRVGKSDYIFPENQYWAEPDIDEAARLLRRAAEDAAWRASLGRAARIRIVTTLSYEAVGKRIVERLSALDADFETLSLARRA